MALLRSSLFALIFYAGTVLYVSAGVVAALISQGGLMRVTHGWARWHRLCARWLVGVRTQIVGTLPAEPVIVASKHQSMFETVEFLILLERPAVVLKRELADLPGWGRVARRYGVIPVDRDGGAVALRRMLKAAREAVAAGRPVMIFPEGTRVLPGEQPELQPGFAGLYKMLALPVVPIALDSGRVWPRRSFVKFPGRVTMKVGETIPPGLPRKEIEARVHAAINALESVR
jgi:1-acyl-sn-glycerol-3-phosphate acyltransferase